MTTNQPSNRTRVVITDFDMPFWSLTTFMVKVAIASIPATAIISAVFAAIMIACLMLLSILGIFGSFLNYGS